jgi:hypothetical protein
VGKQISPPAGKPASPQEDVPNTLSDEDEVKSGDGPLTAKLLGDGFAGY